VVAQTLLPPLPLHEQLLWPVQVQALPVQLYVELL